MADRVLHIEPLTRDAFAPFGQVIEQAGARITTRSMRAIANGTMTWPGSSSAASMLVR